MVSSKIRIYVEPQFFSAGLFGSFGSFLVAFSNAKTESKAVYEYVTIIHSYGSLTVYEQGKANTQEQMKDEKHTLNAAYSTINKFEAQGYALFSNESFVTNTITQSYVLRRKKQ